MSLSDEVLSLVSQLERVETRIEFMDRRGHEHERRIVALETQHGGQRIVTLDDHSTRELASQLGPMLKHGNGRGSDYITRKEAVALVAGIGMLWALLKALGFEIVRAAM